MAAVVVMGVSGCGKSRVGALTAAQLGLPLVEGNEFHSFPAGLVATQFDAPESPLAEPGVIRLDALLRPEALAERVVRWLAGTD
jgi:gluconate kinase